ncbi:MAG TPA: hypothetical protein VGB37_10885 [Candidatus Lokiarchaeia archaeon]
MTQSHPGIDKIKLLEEEYKSIEANAGFPIPTEDIDLANLSERTKRIILRFAKWLSDERIKVEVCSYWESGKLLETFRKIEEHFKIKPKEKERIKEIINRSLNVNL